jgi:putative transposase
MSELRKASAFNMYFVTLTVCGWTDLFTRNIYRDIIVRNLQHCREKEGLQIFCYVLMSNHLHMICNRTDDDLTELLGRFKSFTSKELLQAIEDNPQESRKEWLLHQFEFFAKANKQYSKHHLWQYTSHPVLLYSPEVKRQKRDYIHLNPVRAGIVTEPGAYLYSSACEDSPLKVLQMFLPAVTI